MGCEVRPGEQPAATIGMESFTALSSLPPDQRWRAQTAPAPVVVALIRQPAALSSLEEFLLIKRNDGPYRGQWALVGGKWDFGETLAEAVVREVREETGLSTSFVAVRGVVSERVVPWSSGDPGAHFLLLVCDLLVRSGVAAEQHEGTVAWFERQAIDVLHTAAEIIPSDYAMLREFATATDHAPYVEVEMKAMLDGPAGQSSEMLRFQRYDHR
jgi:ADP-ribose pyrophosphatase YjhB (NUDIX family)